MTVRDRLTDPGRSFTKAEMKIIRELLANYPVGGLTTVSSLASNYPGGSGVDVCG